MPARSILWRCALSIVGCLLALGPLQAIAADLMLYPTRIVFDKNQRAAQVELVNNGSSTLTYRISLVNRRMNETGDFSEANPPLPGEQFAHEMLRYSPRQVVLAPGAAQTVRILLRKPGELAAGEYRSHLLFTQLADAAPAPNAAAPVAPGAGGGLEIKLTPLLGASIPVIVRHGPTVGTAVLTDLNVERSQADQEPVLSFKIGREGNRSLYGDLVATLTPPGGIEQPLARANGVAVYVPNSLRRVRLSLPPAAAQASGTLRLVFLERAEDGGKPLAEARLQLR